LLPFSGKVFNFEYGNFDIEKVNFENGNFELGVGGVTADDDRGCYDPVWPRFDPVLPRFGFDVKCVEVKFFEITYLYHFDLSSKDKEKTMFAYIGQSEFDETCF